MGGMNFMQYQNSMKNRYNSQYMLNHVQNEKTAEKVQFSTPSKEATA